MPTTYFLVDAFTHGRCGGNTAGVCLLNEPMEALEMQEIAAALQQSETAFLYRDIDCFNLRWFTPRVEVALCGHATLAAAHILWETGRLAHGAPATFDTQSGRLSAVKISGWIKLEFPALDVTEVPVNREVVDALGVWPTFYGKSRFDALIVLGTEQEVRQAQPDFEGLGKLTGNRGYMLTARSTAAEYDFVSRFFAPAVGIDEDPVTGSAHCCLGPYWAKIIGRNELVGYQASRRGGIVRVHVGPDRVELSGQAISAGTGVTA